MVFLMIVGIDLGTTTSEIAYYDNNGKAVVIPNRAGELITPSVVHIKRNGRAVVGIEAVALLYTRPESTFIEVKRDFGKDVIYRVNERDYLPEEIQAFILEYLVDCAEEFTGEDVTGAVITVPAYFTDVQRKQTLKAGKLANLDVKRVINEPTAAALDYGLFHMDEHEYILVYDFGGGTLDVTVLELFEGIIDVRSSCGNNNLGGKDFDGALMELIAGKDYDRIITDLKGKMLLKQAAVECKITLTDNDSANVVIPLIVDDLSIEKVITRSEFEMLIKMMVVSTGEQIDTALEDAGLTPNDLNRVIMVGGTTRVPFVRNFVEEKLNISLKDSVLQDNYDYNPELMVARGSAIQAAIIAGLISQEESIVLADVCPFTLGTDTVSTEGLIVDPLIKKNTTIPYEISNVYNALDVYQPSILFGIYQGESKYVQENTNIGEVHLTKLPQKKNELASAELTFSYDVNGILHVKARALGNKSEAETTIDINKSEHEIKPPVKLSNWENAKGASKYRPLLRKADKFFGKFTDKRIFVELKLFAVHHLCNELKAELIRGNMESADILAERIKQFLEKSKDIEEFAELFE
jgi:molecular chaperone DnaK